MEREIHSAANTTDRHKQHTKVRPSVIEGESGGIIGEDAGGDAIRDELLAAEFVEVDGDSDPNILI